MSESSSQSQGTNDDYNSQVTGKVLYQENGLDHWSGWLTYPEGKVICDGSLMLPADSKLELAVAPYYSSDTLPDFAIETEMRFLEGGGGSAGITAYGSLKHDLWQGCLAGITSGYVTEVWSNVGKRNAGRITLGTQMVIGTHKAPGVWFEEFRDYAPYHTFYFDPGKSWHVFQLVIRGNEIELWIDGTVLGRANDYRDRQYLHPGNQMGLWCRNIAINVRSFRVLALERRDELPLKEKPGHPPLDLGETLNAFLTSPEAGIINLTASAVTIATALIIIAKWWKKTHETRSAGSPQRFPQPGKTDIYAIRLRMTDGREHTMSQWLTEPDELKSFIDVFNQPSSQMKPVEAVFVLWNREIIVIDVTKGAQGNLQLDEMLKYLKID